ncbi:hypothetical protein [Longimicrobium sp.]|uniref:hypothetical protein n=1 Tax=Longimicrobium sp. TaxID=2029185 RepID=UPI003B3B37DE
MKSLRLSVLAAALVLGACSSASPTDPAASAARPSFDGGTEDGGNTLGSGNQTTASADTTSRGGNTLGSGN